MEFTEALKLAIENPNKYVFFVVDGQLKLFTNEDSMDLESNSLYEIHRTPNKKNAKERTSGK